MSHDANKVVKCCREEEQIETVVSELIIVDYYALAEGDIFKLTSMELYRCLEKLYSMSRAVKLRTAKSRALSCPLSGWSHTSSHDIFSTVWPASHRMPSKRSRRSTQW